MKKTGVFISLILIFLSGCIASESAHHTTADMVIFSFDRPMQLFALLESIQKYVHGLNELHVIYRASTPEYTDAYQKVFATFAHTIAHQQGANPAADFKPLTLKATFESPSEYILFAVDDIIVKDDITIPNCIDALNKYDAFGFFLRLGENIKTSYMWNRLQPVPSLKKLDDTVFSWQFSQAAWNSDWGYPYTVDMTIYRKKDIEPFLRQIQYENPNRLEGTWSGLAHYVAHKKGLCYKNSKMVNIPLNRVQTVFNNRAMHEFSPRDLLELFNQNKKIDIQPLAQISNRAAHMEYTPTFVAR